VLPEDVNIIEHRRLNNLVELTEGGFGIVYRAEHEDWGTVAYKQLKATVIKTETRSVPMLSFTFFSHFCHTVHCRSDTLYQL